MGAREALVGRPNITGRTTDRKAVSGEHIKRREKVKDIDQLLDRLDGLKARVEKLKECL
jgi:hypothetical protein